MADSVVTCDSGRHRVGKYTIYFNLKEEGYFMITVKHDGSVLGNGYAYVLCISG